MMERNETEQTDDASHQQSMECHSSAHKRPFSGPPEEKPNSVGSILGSCQAVEEAYADPVDAMLTSLRASATASEKKSHNDDVTNRPSVLLVTPLKTRLDTQHGNDEDHKFSQESPTIGGSEDVNAITDGDYQMVTNKKSRKRPLEQSDDGCESKTYTPTPPEHKTPRGTSSSASKNAVLKARDLTVFIKGCHRSLAAYCTDNWTMFERAFNKKFHAPASFKMAGHCLKVVCCNLQQRALLLKSEEICEQTVKVSEPYGRTHMKGKTTKHVIHNVPTSLNDDDIMKATSAASARRIISNRGNNQRPTGVVVLELHGKAPDSVNIGVLLFKVKPFIPHPIRCARCQSFKHRQTQCTQKPRCVRCSSESHNYDDCPVKDQPEQHKCCNCSGRHSAAFRGCPTYRELQETLKQKAMKGTAYAPATKKVNDGKDGQHPTNPSIKKTCNGERASATARKFMVAEGKNNDLATDYNRDTTKRPAQKRLMFDNTRNDAQSTTYPENRTDHQTAPRTSTPTSTRAENRSAKADDRARRNDDAITLKLIYALAEHVVDIATDVSYSAQHQLNTIADQLLQLGQRIHGKDWPGQ